MEIRMSGFWDHYAQANDDIRSQLIDRAWFNQRFPSNAMQTDVHSMARDEQSQDVNSFYGDVHSHQGDTQNFYGQPAETAHQPEMSDDYKAVYGEDPQHSEAADIYGNSEAPEEMQANDLYGYDALDEEEGQDQTQRL